MSRQSEITGASMKMGSRAIAKSGIGALAAPALVEETVEVTLSETATLMHLSIPSLIVASDTRDVMAVDERNARYTHDFMFYSSEDITKFQSFL